VRLQRGREPKNRPNWAETRRNRRRIQSWFHHMNIHASTRALAGVMQTILKEDCQFFKFNNHFLNIWLLAARLLGWHEGQLGIA
jgi:hypothetical protein